MTDLRPAAFDRRRFLAVGGVVGAGALLAACTSNEPHAGRQSGGQPARPRQRQRRARTRSSIGFSAPAADHGWIAAIGKNAEAHAKQYTDVKFKPVEPTNEVTRQISAVETLIADKVNALVILPTTASSLTRSPGRRRRPASRW